MAKMSQTELAQRFPTFINNSGLPINLETWQITSSGFNSLEYVLVKNGEEYVMQSTNGEWYLQTYLDEEYCNQWIEHGITPGYEIGKFRNKPCASGDYSWMDNNNFNIVYDKEKNTATFMKVSK